MKAMECPVAATLALIGGKHKPLILWQLADGPLHYMELLRLVGASAKVLTEQLRELERCGMIRRQVLPARPPRTSYGLTPFGESVLPVLEAMCSWGRAYLAGQLPGLSRSR